MEELRVNCVGECQARGWGGKRKEVMGSEGERGERRGTTYAPRQAVCDEQGGGGGARPSLSKLPFPWVVGTTDFLKALVRQALLFSFLKVPSVAEAWPASTKAAWSPARHQHAGRLECEVEVGCSLPRAFAATPLG